MPVKVDLLNIVDYINSQIKTDYIEQESPPFRKRRIKLVTVALKQVSNESMVLFMAGDLKLVTASANFSCYGDNVDELLHRLEPELVQHLGMQGSDLFQGLPDPQLQLTGKRYTRSCRKSKRQWFRFHKGICKRFWRFCKSRGQGSWPQFHEEMPISHYIVKSLGGLSKTTDLFDASGVWWHRLGLSSAYDVDVMCTVRESFSVRQVRK